MIHSQHNLAEMFRAYRAAPSDERRNAIIEEAMPLAEGAARRMVGRFGGAMEYGEVLSAACIGLMQAVESFDLSRGLTFATHATHRIRGAILDEARATDHVPKDCRKALKRIARARAAFHAREGRPPTDEELRAEVGVSEKRWGELKGSAHVARDRGGLHRVRGGKQVRIDHAVPTRTRRRNPTARGRVSGSEPMMLLPPSESDDWWHSATRGLTREERMLVIMCYRDGIHQDDAARTIGVTESRVSQILKSVRERLRQSPYLRRLLAEEVRDAA